MAIITKLREKMGRLVVFAVGFAILSFVLADMLGPNSQLLGGGQDNTIGKVLGEDITLQEYQATVDELVANYEMQLGRAPTEQVMVTLREQAWELMISRIAFQAQYDELGVKVNEEELWDMVQGKNVSSQIKNIPQFQDPATGEFDRQKLIQFLQNMRNAPPENQVSWQRFEQDLKPSRQRIKYENLLIKSNYVTEEVAKYNYDYDNTLAEVKYLYIPYYSINDSLVAEPTESQLRVYLENHKDEFRVENTRSLKYVQFPIIPSGEDSVYYEEEIESLKEEFMEVRDDSVFASINSDIRNFYNAYNISNLPAILRDSLNKFEEGKVIGPIHSEGRTGIYKISKISEDTTSHAKASHILFEPENETPQAKAEARQEATRILREIQNGANFEEMAREYGSDGTATRGGDLGWGQKGVSWVPEFEEAVFTVESEGIINRIIETDYGFHIIKVTGTSDNRKFTIASIQREISPSDETRERAFRKAGMFASDVVNRRELEQKAETQSLDVFDVQDIGKNTRNIRGLGEAREVVRWLFNDATKNKVSDVMELDDAFVVAVMTDETPEGVAKLENVQSEVVRKVKDQLKGDKIIEKLSTLEGSLEDMATTYGEDAQVYTMTDLKMSSNSLNGVGLDPYAVGKVFGLEEGESTEPFKSQNGVLILELQNITKAGEIADYSSVKDQVLTAMENQTAEKLTEAIKESADIVDARYKFY